MEESKEQNPLDRAMTIYTHMLKMGYISQEDADLVARIIEEGKDAIGSDSEKLDGYVVDGENNIRYSGYVTRSDYIKLFANQVVGAAKQGKAVVFPVGHIMDEEVADKLVRSSKNMTPNDLDRMFGYENEIAINNQDERFFNHFYREGKTVSSTLRKKLMEVVGQIGLAKRQPSEVKDPKYDDRKLRAIDDDRLYAGKKDIIYSDPKYDDRKRRAIDDEHLYARKKDIIYNDPKYDGKRVVDEREYVYAQKEDRIYIDPKNVRKRQAMSDEDVNTNSWKSKGSLYMEAYRYIQMKDDEPLLKVINSRISGYV